MTTALPLTLALAGCGNSGKVPDAQAKQRISTAALTIATECIGTPDAATIEDQVTALLEETKAAGDQHFTLSNTFRGVTMATILRDRATFMDRHHCAPGQAKRLRDAAK